MGGPRLAGLRTWWRKYGLAVAPGLLLILAIAVMQSVKIPVISPLVDRIGLSVFDSYQRISPRKYQDAPVRIIDIDDETIRRMGQWPWPRTDIARLTQKLGDAGAAAIGFDIVFSETDRTSPHALAKRFEATDPGVASQLAALPDNDDQLASIVSVYPVVLGFFLTPGVDGTQVAPKAGMVSLGTPPSSVANFGDAVVPLPKLVEPAAGLASLSILPDSDSVIRRAPLIGRQGDTILPSLSLESLRVALQTDSVMIKTTDGSAESSAPGDVVSVRVGDTEVPTNAAGEMWMYYTKPVPDRIVPAWKLLEDALSPEEKARLIEGNITFIGTSAIGLRDLRSTPLNDTELGVMVHAQAAEQIIHQDFLTRPDWAVGLERALLVVLGILLVLRLPTLGAVWGGLIGGVMITGILLGSWLAFTKYGYLLDPTWPVLGLILAYVTVTGLTFYREEKQRAYIHQAFDRYLAPELVKRIAEDPTQLQLGGEERDMTVLFCDVRSFSSISEKLSPDEIIRFLIALLTPLTDTLLASRATIDKYIGDAILAFWNAPLDDPDQHRNAARASLAMVALTEELNRNPPTDKGVEWPGNVKIGIGLNSGLCCVGNMGSEQRLSYSLIGDTVNLASRIEGLTKYYGVEIAIGDSLRREIEDFACLEIDQVRVVGRDRPEAVHVLLGDETMASDPAFEAFAAQHKAILAAYRAREWDTAAALIDAAQAGAEHYRLTKLHALYQQRIDTYRSKDPGEGWDGVYTAESK